MDTKTSNPTTVAGRVLEAMQRADRSKKWTAERAGLSETTFRRKLNGGSDFTVAEVARIAQALAMPALELLPPAFASERAA